MTRQPGFWIFVAGMALTVLLLIGGPSRCEPKEDKVKGLAPEAVVFDAADVTWEPTHIGSALAMVVYEDGPRLRWWQWRKRRRRMEPLTILYPDGTPMLHGSPGTFTIEWTPQRRDDA
jgi:hypothetical protein